MMREDTVGGRRQAHLDAPVHLQRLHRRRQRARAGRDGGPINRHARGIPVGLRVALEQGARVEAAKFSAAVTTLVPLIDPDVRCALANAKTKPKRPSVSRGRRQRAAIGLSGQLNKRGLLARQSCARTPTATSHDVSDWRTAVDWREERFRDKACFEVTGPPQPRWRGHSLGWRVAPAAGCSSAPSAIYGPGSDRAKGES